MAANPWGPPALLRVIEMLEATAIHFSRYLGLCATLILVGLNGGCGGGSGPTQPPPSVGKMYVSLNTFSKIQRFNMSDNGDPAPGATLTAFNLRSPKGLALDVANDRLYVCGVLNADISVFNNASTRNGSAPPERQIVGASTTLTFPESPALDTGRDLLYVIDNGRILVFASASTATGNVAPSHIITLPFAVGRLALDALNDRLFVSESTNAAVAVFDGASTLNGAAAPNRVISGAATQLSQPDEVVLDASGHLIVVDANGISATRRLLIFPNAGSASGNVLPSASAVVPNQPIQMAVSSAGDLYVTDGGSVSVYAGIAAATGTLTPTRSISGPNSGIAVQFGQPAAALGIALDQTR